VSLGFRCAAASEARGEPVSGSASTVRRFLLVEVPGPWGRDALRHSRLTGAIGEELLRRCAAAGVRPLLVRRHGRSSPRRTTVFAAVADPARPWLGRADVDRPAAALDLPLDRLEERPDPFAATPGPLFLVCTHGKHDACCAERGRPLAAALAGAVPEHTWEVSHIGGDRFAGNVLVLPDGLYYGRLDADSGVTMAREHLDGRLDLDHLRGRSGYPFAAQAAETFLRSHTGVLAKDQGRLLGCRREEDEVSACFEMADERWRVRMRRGAAPPQQLTCQATRSSPAVTHALVGIDRLD
jgi:hypothetical protein